MSLESLLESQHGGVSLQISGGSGVDVQRVPYQAAVEVSSEHACGAAIVAAQWVLTSADCVASKDMSLLRVRVGSSEREMGGTLLEVVNVVTHDKFDATTLSHNVALLQTRAPVPRSPSVRSVALVASGARPKGGARFLVSGWGKTSLGEFFKPRQLQSLGVTLVSRTLCRAAYAKEATTVDGTVLCARGQDWKGVCEGDFGGPLVDDLQQLVGVASWGKGCGFPAYPAVFVDLAQDDVNDWVRKTAGIAK